MIRVGRLEVMWAPYWLGFHFWWYGARRGFVWDLGRINVELLPPCDPSGACDTHGRCWTHSDWAP